MSFLSRVKQLFGGDKPVEEESQVETPEIEAESQESVLSASAQTLRQQAGSVRREAADFDALEELLIDAGIDVDTTMAILQEVRKGGLLGHPTAEKVIERIRDKLSSMLDLDSTLHTTGSPAVVLITGVNGAGKTSSIAKLANILKQENRSVLLVAADTFRA